MPLSREADPLPVVDARRDLDVEAPLLEHAACAVAVLAGVLDDPAGTGTAPARLAAHELAEPGTRHVLEASASPAVRAARDGRAGLDLRGDVRSARAARARRDAEDVVSEEGREDVGEAAEVERRRPEAATPQPGVAEAVIELARLGLREDLVGLDDLLEALVCIGR